MTIRPKFIKWLEYNTMPLLVAYAGLYQHEWWSGWSLFFWFLWVLTNLAIVLLVWGTAKLDSTQAEAVAQVFMSNQAEGHPLPKWLDVIWDLVVIAFLFFAPSSWGMLAAGVYALLLSLAEWVKLDIEPHWKRVK